MSRRELRSPEAELAAALTDVEELTPEVEQELRRIAASARSSDYYEATGAALELLLEEVERKRSALQKIAGKEDNLPPVAPLIVINEMRRLAREAL